MSELDIQITGVHYQVSDKVRSYISEKIGSLAKYAPDLSAVHVTIHNGDKFGYRVDVEMHLPHGRDIVAHDSEETVYSAIDVVADKAASSCGVNTTSEQSIVVVATVCAWLVNT